MARPAVESLWTTFGQYRASDGACCKAPGALFWPGERPANVRYSSRKHMLASAFKMTTP